MMPRQRMIKPDFFTSETLAHCSHTARLLFIGLWVMGDDYGNISASIKKLKLQVFPFDAISEEELAHALIELEEVGCIKGYIVGNERYISIPNFNTYQTIRKPSNTSIPEPPKDTKDSTRTALVRQWYGTSDALVQTLDSTNNPRPGETSLVQHYDGTSNELKKERRKEELSPYLRDSSSPKLNVPADSGGGVEDHPPLPPQIGRVEDLINAIDAEMGIDNPFTAEQYKKTMEHRANVAAMAEAAIPCPEELNPFKKAVG